MAAKNIAVLLTGLALVACGDKDADAPETTNKAPFADAGADASGDGTTRIALDGGGSYDPDGDPIVWHWTFDTVPQASSLDQLENPFTNNHTDSGATTSFLPDAAGTYVVQLVVEDSNGASSLADYVIVTVDGGDMPVANAGADQQVEAGATVTLDGTRSYDPLGRDLTYDWDLVSKPEASTVDSLTGSSTANPTFEADAGGVYVATLTVNNGFHDSAGDAVYIYVSTGDPAPPVAIAGDDIDDAQDCMDLALDGTDSYDPNGDELEYMWSLQTKPAGSETDNYSFADRTDPTTTFYPDISGTYVFSLSVNDGSEWSQPDELTAIVAERWANTEPAVEAGPVIEVSAGTALCSEAPYSTWECGTCDPVTVAIGTTATISDAEGDPYEIEWSVLEGTASFTGPTDEIQSSVYLSGATPNEPDRCAQTTYRLWLGAEDCPQDEGGDSLVIKVECCGELYGADSGR